MICLKFRMLLVPFVILLFLVVWFWCWLASFGGD